MLIKQFWIVFVEVIVPHEDVCHLPELNVLSRRLWGHVSDRI